jgi:hypothetical protein
MISSWRHRFDADTSVLCPACGEHTLRARFSCLGTGFDCPRCHAVFQLSDLVDRLDEAQFEALAAVVGDRLSDRVG